jgi:hypothetical protein
MPQVAGGQAVNCIVVGQVAAELNGPVDTQPERAYNVNI